MTPTNELNFVNSPSEASEFATILRQLRSRAVRPNFAERPSSASAFETVLAQLRSERRDLIPA